ncbi:lipase 3-like isoform X2 [Nylanderia fulva]|uniref:lipase 3-like isoform X2 n=1 Tax=Nylanderia fulva TaxID=613905 RepID=UPI0010FAF665|nr:lipase 3-like isoform X2 [Nylanderia fulva]
MGVKLFFLSIIFIVILSEAEQLSFSDKIQTLFNYLFPKNPGIKRIRNAEEARGVKQVTTLDFIGLVERHGYPAEEHSVTTEDGYNLKIHRIPSSPLSKNQNKTVVFMMHGILCSSDCWVLLGPNKDLSFLLADEGYDVWVGNYRGNTYCRSNVKMSPRDANFWQFSFHDVGVKDLPVMIDYVLNYTKSKDLHFIGHSMGTTSVFVLLSTKPEYNAKIKLGICLAPIAFWKEVGPSVKFLEFLDIHDINELFSLSSTSITAGRLLCPDNNVITQAFCVTLLFSIAGSDPAQLNTTIITEIFSHFPAGTSKKNLLHYLQNVITGDFQDFDYGYLGNNKRYKQATPMKYNLKKVTAPLALFYGANDLITMNNPLQLYKQLPNAILIEKNSYTLFTHLDFIWAIDAKTLLYDRVIEVMQKFDIESNPYRF